MNSKYLTIDRKDAIKAGRLFVTAFLTSVLTITATGKLPVQDDFISCLVIAITSSFSYLVNKYLTNSNDQFLIDDGKQ